MNLSRILLHIHRVLGFVLSILFLVWFLSGMVMMYRTYPSVTEQQRMAHAERIAMREAIPSPPMPQGLSALSLQQVAGRPVFLMSTAEGETQVDALTGKTVVRFLPEAMQSIAARWSSAAPVLKDTLNEIDVWLIGAMPFKEFPVYHYSLNDSEGSELYLSSRTGRALQLTSRESRFWAWVGAIPHWIYITKLRATGRQPWTDTVQWLSGFGILMVICGIIVGLRSMWKARKRKGAGLSPYVKPLFRWHHLFGLFFGLFVLTWIFSGFMSLADAPQLLWPVHNEHSARQLYADSLKADHYRLDINRVLAANDVRRVEWMEIGKHPYYRVWTADDEYLLDASDTVPHRVKLNEADCRKAVQQVHEPSERVNAMMMNNYDNYYVSQKRTMPLPVCKVTVDDADRSTYYINPKTGDCRYYNNNRRAGKWMYTGLHALNLPFFVAHPMLRLAIMWVLMIGGTIVSVTGLLLTVRYIRRKINKR